MKSKSYIKLLMKIGQDLDINTKEKISRIELLIIKCLALKYLNLEIVDVESLEKDKSNILKIINLLWYKMHGEEYIELDDRNYLDFRINLGLILYSIEVPTISKLLMKIANEIVGNKYLRRCKYGKNN
ncbi:hypothetical protein [Streptobacillus canis]|uniref:hypothetical protein n=1 Tax=Streptobacillus canis TaxID=2678686 RepID=UPI0012E1FA4F|nr:hypothetical protein [Streptobacillus canis]